MAGILVEGAKSFRIQYEHIDGVALGCEPCYGLLPHPKSLGARLNRWAHSEPLLLIEEHAIQQIRLAGAVHAHHGNYADRSVQVLQELEAVLIDRVFYYGSKDGGYRWSRGRAG